MSGVRLEITVDDGGLGRAIQRAYAAAEDLTPVLESSGQLLVTNFTERFDTETGPGGIPWKPSRAALGLEPRASGKINPGKTLTDTGAYRESITHAVGESQVEVGSQRPAPGNVERYAAAHHFGIGGIPVRQVVGIDDQDVAELEDLWTDVVREGFNGASN